MADVPSRAEPRSPRKWNESVEDSDHDRSQHAGSHHVNIPTRPSGRSIRTGESMTVTRQRTSSGRSAHTKTRPIWRASKGRVISISFSRVAAGLVDSPRTIELWFAPLRHSWKDEPPFEPSANAGSENTRNHLASGRKPFYVTPEICECHDESSRSERGQARTRTRGRQDAVRPALSPVASQVLGP